MSTQTPALSDVQIARLFDQAGLAIPEDMRPQVWAEVHSLKACADYLRLAATDVLASKAGTA